MRRVPTVQCVMKRALDVVGAAAGLAVSAPLLAAAAVAVRFTMGRPVLFRQTRPGRGGVPFTIIKLRTMRDATDIAGRARPDSERLTSLGRVLRASSVDELPELWNVLRGDMSLVGPRPLLMEYLDRYTTEQARRHEVRPGITGWAQVHGRNALTWDEKFALDLWYVDHWSIGVDLRILFRTVAIVFARQGVSHAGDATMPPFTGSAPQEPVPSARR
jgi:lipopolysaccharide/colanic/teichoic acid biosynthesis glycosyltransferase